MDDEMLVEDVAAYLEIDRDTVYQQIIAGRLSARRLGRLLLLVDRASVLAYRQRQLERRRRREDRHAATN